MKTLFKLFSVIAFVSGAAFAEAPDVKIKAVSDSLIGRLSAEKAAIKTNPALTQTIVKELVVPHFDARRMARQVLGKYRKTASEEQVERFTTEFASYLVRYYSKAFANYDGETIKINDKVDYPSEKLATVKTSIVRNKGADVPVNYTLEKQDDQSWKIVDVAIEGIGLVQSKKEEYGGVIASSSLDKLISDLAAINQGGPNK